MAADLAGGVVAKVGGPELHEAPSREDADGVAVLGAVRFRVRIRSLVIWRKVQFSVQNSQK